MGIAENIENIKRETGESVTLVAVSKYSSDEQVQKAYDAGHRDFGENKAQDLAARYQEFPDDVHWHFVGHLQRNKVKYIAPFIHLIHSVDSLRLLQEINKQAEKANRIISCLLQMHIAREETKFGLDADEVYALLNDPEIENLKFVHISGLMGMATNTDNDAVVEKEFSALKATFESLKTSPFPENVKMDILSMGMSADYGIAMRNGSNMVRIGSAVFND